MELDSLELVRRIEEEFSIYLPNDELLEVYTVDNLYSLLLRKLKPTPDCLTSKAFYRIRRAMTAALGLPRRSIRPSSFLDDLLDEKRVREQWTAIADKSGLKFPRLCHTAEWKHWMQILSAALSFLNTLALMGALSRFAFITLDNFFLFLGSFIFGLFLFAALYTMLLKVTPFRRSVLPTLSAGELARVVLSMNNSEFALETNDAAKLTQDQVWLRLVGVFCDQMAVSPEDVVPSASIVVDLGQN